MSSRSNQLSKVHALFQHVASKSLLTLKRWTQGLAMMLEKIEENIRVNKLHAMLLMEDDFNQVKIDL